FETLPRLGTARLFPSCRAARTADICSDRIHYTGTVRTHHYFISVPSLSEFCALGLETYERFMH
ncbi:MAG TPA: hypothetical protein VGL29_05840, partial [Blastocatellia bacterium]